MPEFKRKHDYNNATLADVNELINISNEMYQQGRINMPILVIPQIGSLDCYYNGNVIASIDDEKWKVSKSFRSFIKGTDDYRNYMLDDSDDHKNLCAYLKKVEVCDQNARERRCQQVISLNNISPEPNAFSVCGFETALSGRKGEIDMVVFSPKRRQIFLVEYKCTTAALRKGHGVVEHCKDYINIIRSGKTSLVNGIVDAYDVIRKLNGRHKTSIDRSSIDVKILFLFTANNSPDANTGTISLKRAYNEYRALMADTTIPDEYRPLLRWEYALDYRDYVFDPENFME